MTSTAVAAQPTDAERFGRILQVQRAAYLRDGAPSSAARCSAPHGLKAALIARRGAIEEAINRRMAGVLFADGLSRMT